MSLNNIKPKETVLTKENIEAISLTEQLKRLLKYRRFSAGQEIRTQTTLDRVTYIRIAIDLGKQAGYNERRLIRLGHEFNRSFHASMAPAQAHELIMYEVNRIPFHFEQSDWTYLLGLTSEEFFIVHKHDDSIEAIKEIFD